MGRDIDRYSDEYRRGYGFEKDLVPYRQQVVIEHLRALKPRVVLEVGCGTDLLYRRYLEASEPVDRWVIVEPSESFARAATLTDLPGLQVVQGFMEESVDAVREVIGSAADAAICSALLHEVPSAGELLGAIRRCLDSSSWLHVNVANATSLHRRLARAMGLIDKLSALSERNMRLQQRKVYDRVTLAREVERAGFRVESQGGYLVKPFTHDQMAAILPIIGQEVLDGLFRLGEDEPDWACEIFVLARPEP